MPSCSRAQATISSPGCVSSGFGPRTSTPIAELFSGKRAQRLACEPVDGPVRVGPCAEPLVEPDRAFVPVEHRPLEAAAPALHRDLGEPLEQRLADARPALLGDHEKVLEVEAWLGQKRREVVKEKGEADGLAAVLGDESLGVWALAEKRAAELLLGQRDLVLQAFVAREGANQAGDERHVRALSRADAQSHLDGRSLRR